MWTFALLESQQTSSFGAVYQLVSEQPTLPSEYTGRLSMTACSRSDKELKPLVRVAI
jgi:hypothetical protein